MSKSSKKYAWLSSKPNSAKTIIERAKREVPGFRNDYKKFEEQMVIGGYSSSTLYNYSRAVGSLALHFKLSISESFAKNLSYSSRVIVMVFCLTSGNGNTIITL